MPSESSLRQPGGHVSSLWSLVRKFEVAHGVQESSGLTREPASSAVTSLPAEDSTRRRAPLATAGRSGGAGRAGTAGVPTVPFATAEGTRKWWDALNEVATDEPREGWVEGLDGRRRVADRHAAADLGGGEAGDEPVLRPVASS